MSMPWDGGQGLGIDGKDLYFNDLDVLEDGERAIGLRIGVNLGEIASVATIYNSGRACHHDGWNGKPNSGVQYLDWTPSAPVNSIQILARGNGNRRWAVDITLRNQHKALRCVAPNSPGIPSTLVQLTAPTGWEFAGFWGYKSFPGDNRWAGFAKLGVVWTRAKPVTIPKALPLYDGDVEKTLPPGLITMLKPEKDLGRWIRLTGLDASTREPGNSFATWLGSDWVTRGVFPGTPLLLLLRGRFRRFPP